MLPLQCAMSRIWIFVHLLALSAEDIWERQLFMPAILELGFIGLIRMVWSPDTPAVLPGILLLAAGYVTGERIGYGDGWLILALGMWLDNAELIRMLLTGSSLACVCGIFLRRREVPFVPFLAAAYVIGEWL